MLTARRADVHHRDLKSLCQTTLVGIEWPCRVLGACDETIGTARTHALMGVAGAWTNDLGYACLHYRLPHD
jgi:hypothetical protein